MGKLTKNPSAVTVAQQPELPFNIPKFDCAILGPGRAEMKLFVYAVKVAGANPLSLLNTLTTRTWDERKFVSEIVSIWSPNYPKTPLKLDTMDI